MIPRLAFASALCLLLGCGGLATGVGRVDGGSEGGGADASAGSDAAACVIRGVPTGPGGCLQTEPTEGACCDPSQSICEPSDPCCVGYVWTCAQQNDCHPGGCTSVHVWQKLGLGCACPIRDAGGGPDALADVADAGQAGCGPGESCRKDEVCVQTNSGGGPCEPPADGGVCPPGAMLEGGCCVRMSTTYACKPVPAVCGPAASCSSACASAICMGCPCADAVGDHVTCDCLAP